LSWLWSLAKRHLSNKCCFYQNKICFIAHELGGCDTVRRLFASGGAYECRTTWSAGRRGSGALGAAGMPHAGRFHLGLGGRAYGTVCGVCGAATVRVDRPSSLGMRVRATVQGWVRPVMQFT